MTEQQMKDTIIKKMLLKQPLSKSEQDFANRLLVGTGFQKSTRTEDSEEEEEVEEDSEEEEEVEEDSEEEEEVEEDSEEEEELIEEASQPKKWNWKFIGIAVAIIAILYFFYSFLSVNLTMAWGDKVLFGIAPAAIPTDFKELPKLSKDGICKQHIEMDCGYLQGSAYKACCYEHYTNDKSTCKNTVINEGYCEARLPILLPYEINTKQVGK